MVDAFQGLEIVFDYCGFDVVFSNDYGLEHEDGDLRVAVGDGFVGVGFLAFGEAHGFVGSDNCFVGDGLVDGHRLGALGDADDSG